MEGQPVHLYSGHSHMSNMYAYAQLSTINSCPRSLPRTHTRTHTVYDSPPAAVRQTEGRAGNGGSQVARVQAVVCTVISAQVFKQPDVHRARDKGGGGDEAVMADAHMNRDLR